MKTTRKPSIFASITVERYNIEVVAEVSQLPFSTSERISRGTLSCKADFMAAYCAAVEIAIPNTDPSDRRRFRVDVATARSSFLARA